MKKSIKQYFLHSLFSGQLVTLFVAMLLMLVGMQILGFMGIENDVKNYNKNVEYFLSSEDSNSMTLDEAQNQTFTYEESGGYVFIENPLAYSKDKLEKSLYSMSPAGSIDFLLNSTSVLLTLVVCAFSLILVSNDYRHKTLKLKSARANRVSLEVSRQIFMQSVTVVALTVVLIVAYLIGFIFWVFIKNQVAISDFDVFRFSLNNLTLKLLLAFGIPIMYSQITYTIGNITKTPYFGITVLAGYMFVLPTFGKYDLKNIVNHFAEKAFDYFGVLSKPQPFPGVSSTYGVGIFCVLFFLCLSCNYFITKKRTAFV